MDDRHPDVKTPKEAKNLHAMVLGHLLGRGAHQFSREVKVPLKPENALFAGLGTVIAQEKDFIAELGIRRAGAKDLALDSQPVLQWIRDNDINYLAIHLDVDVLDPALFRSLQAGNPEADPNVSVRTGEMTFRASDQAHR